MKSDRVLAYCGEAQRVNLDTEGGHVLLLEFTCQMTLDEGGLHIELYVSMLIEAREEMSNFAA